MSGSVNQLTSNISNLPEDVLGNWIARLDLHNFSALSRVNTFFHQLCKKIEPQNPQRCMAKAFHIVPEFPCIYTSDSVGRWRRTYLRK